MNKINVFRNGSEMPWTYYQADVLSHSDKETESEGRNRLMFTSESKPGPNGQNAGKYVSQIKRFVRFGNGETFKEQTINNPSIADYKSWGWKLSSDPMTGEEKLPEYGEFAFKPGMEPNYEDLSSMTVDFKFGFGLNNTCYNFADEQVTIQVYNLSCQPKVFCTNNAFCEIKYDAATGSFGPDLTPQNDDGTICCTATEGSPNAQSGKGYAYIMTCLESGEQLDVSFVNYGTDLSKQQLKLTVESSTGETSYTEESAEAGFRLSKVYRSNVEGDGSLNVTGGIKYDFLRLKVSALDKYQNLKYNNGKLCVNLKLTPVAFGDRLESFSTYVTVFLDLTKDVGESSIPGIRAATNAIEGFKMNDPSGNKSGREARRARLIVTAKEAINYAIRNNEGPSFIRGKTADEAFKFYQRSMLTETEKNIDDYKQSFASDEMIRKLAHFMVTDLSGTKGVATQQFTDGITSISVKPILDDTKVQEVYNLLRSDLGGEEPCMENMPLSKIYENANRASKFQELVDQISTMTKSVDDNGKDAKLTTAEKAFAHLRPFVDASANTQRKFGYAMNKSTGNHTAAQKKEKELKLISNDTTVLAILFAINNYKKTGSDPFLNKYMDALNENRSSQSTGNSTLFWELITIMSKEYHQNSKTVAANTTWVSESKNRPMGLFEELYNYRYQLNPVEGIGARKYINEIIEIKDVSGTDTTYYGTDEIYKSQNLLPVKAGQQEIEQLLYTGDLSSSIGKNNFHTSPTLLKEGIFNEGLQLTGILFQRGPRKPSIAGADGDSGCVFYSDMDASDNKNFEGQFRGSNEHQFSKTLRANPADVSNSALEGKWVLTTNGDMAKAYAEGSWHPENCDLSGVIKVPDASNGCYWDVFIDGQEVRETIVDLEEVYSNIDGSGGGVVAEGYDLSNLRNYYVNDEEYFSRHYMNQNVKNIMLPDTLTADEKKQYRYTNVGIYSFFRIGEAIKFIANLEDLDAETAPAMKFPEIKIRERNDKTGLCQTVISDAYVPLKDVQSELRIKMNLERDYGEGYDISNNTTYVTTDDFRSAWYWPSTDKYLDIEGGVYTLPSNSSGSGHGANGTFDVGVTTSGSGSDLSLNITTTGGGGAATINAITNPGRGYQVGDSITLLTATGASAGGGAKVITLTDKQVVSSKVEAAPGQVVNVTDAAAGSSYTASTTYVANTTGGTGAGLKLHITTTGGGAAQVVGVAYPGKGYASGDVINVLNTDGNATTGTAQQVTLGASNISNSNFTVKRTTTPWSPDSSGIYTSRWGTLCVPLDITGQLERGEEFQLSTEYDSWTGINDITDISAGKRNYTSWNNMFAGTNDLSHQIPSNITDCGFKIEYQNLGDVAWTCADGVTFSYECHNKSKTVSSANDKTSDGSVYTDNSDNGGNKTKSSNIKGMPRFRVCLKPQNKLLQYYNNFSNENSIANSGNPESAFSALGRKVEVHLKYSKSAKKRTDGSADSDGNNQKETVRVIVDDDLYSANIATQKLTYNRKSDSLTKDVTKPIRKLAGTGTYPSTAHAYNEDKSVVGPGVKEGPNSQQQCVPDYSRQQIYSINYGDYKHLGDGAGERSIDFREAEFRENNHGLSKPIATISASNFKLANGEYSCKAEIAPLFKFQGDENDFAASGTYCSISNNKAVDDNDDAKDDAPRLIPANTNYGIYATDNNTKFHLYRINNLNYEEWVGGTGDIYTMNNFYDSDNNTPFREIVNVKLTYFSPSDNAGAQNIVSQGVQHSMGVRQEQQIVFMVQPKDKKELSYPENFHFTVNEGDNSVDITSILSATLEGKSSSDMKYYVRGAVHESGEVYLYTTNNTLETIKDFKASADASSITETATTQAGHLTGLTFDVATTYAQTSDINHSSKISQDLKTYLVNDKLILYHKNHLSASTPTNNIHFDAYEKREYKFLVEASYTGNMQSTREASLSLVTITVLPGATGFYLEDGKKWYYNVTETLGTLSEGKGLMGNNPDIALSNFTENLRHEDLTGALHNYSNVTWRIADLDEDLMVTEGNGLSSAAASDFSNQVIRLKDIDANKTTETATSGSTQLAPYNHYNYERKSEYKVTLEVCLSNFQEVCVEKVTNYICGFGETNDDAWTDRTGSEQAKTTTYLMKKDDNPLVFSNSVGPDDSTLEGKLYYFKDPETGLYQGPLSAVPSTLSQLEQKTQVHGVTVRDAYVRYDQPGDSTTNSGGYQPLFKTAEFKENLVKAPKPSDNCLQPFTIKVLDSYDKAKVSPQPYMIKDKSQAYCTADPVHQEVLDNELITTQTSEAGSTIAYVYADHKEFQNKYSLDKDTSTDETNNDLPNDFKVPSWHPLYSNAMSSSANSTTAVQRVIHPFGKMSNSNAVYNNGMLNGTPDGHINKSLRYGCFSETDQSDTVVLDYFIEYHGKIDPSGENEISLLNNGELMAPPFGSRITDYSNSIDISSLGESNVLSSIANSEHRMIRADNICRNRKHVDSSTANKYYATAEIDVNDSAQIGRTYNFTVAAVSNVLASRNDMSYNKNMVDWNETFYPKIKMQPDGGSTTDKYPQPFQKYVYDPSGERIVTRSYARLTNDVNGGVDQSGTIITNEFAINSALAIDNPVFANTSGYGTSERTTTVTTANATGEGLTTNVTAAYGVINGIRIHTVGNILDGITANAAAADKTFTALNNVVDESGNAVSNRTNVTFTVQEKTGMVATTTVNTTPGLGYALGQLLTVPAVGGQVAPIFRVTGITTSGGNSGVLTSLEIVSPGSGKSAGATEFALSYVTGGGSGGSGAKVKYATIVSGLYSAAVATNGGGTGYLPGDRIKIPKGTGGTDAIIEVTSVRNGVITASPTLNKNGNYYADNDAFTIDGGVVGAIISPLTVTAANRGTNAGATTVGTTLANFTADNGVEFKARVDGAGGIHDIFLVNTGYGNSVGNLSNIKRKGTSTVLDATVSFSAVSVLATGLVNNVQTITSFDKEQKEHQDLQNSGTLLCCRTHFNVCVTNGGSGPMTTITAKTGNYEARTQVYSDEANLKFDGGLTNGVLNANNTITPKETVNSVNGDIRLFAIGNGQVVMAQYMNKVWTSLNH